MNWTDIPMDWQDALRAETQRPEWGELADFLEAERKAHTILPDADDVFNAFRFTPMISVRVVILGQDPYPTPGVPHGLSFSVRPGTPIPASLRNIYRELRDDLGITTPTHGCLTAWAKRGVLLLNTCLTVRAGEPNSHAKRGWERFTDAAMRAVSSLEHRVAFVLWGKAAARKAELVDSQRHTVICSAHPSPLSARTGFFGSKPFSRVNAALPEPINWELAEEPE